MNRDLTALLAPKSIAVVGASPRGNRGLTILKNLARFGSTARIYPVHPRARIVAGLPAYRNLAELPEVCDFVAIALDADTSLDILEEAIDRGTRAALLIAGGFGEGGLGVRRRDRLRSLVERSAIALCGPNCYGILNVPEGFAAYSGEIVEPFTRGRIALVMQSGALTHSVTDSAVGRGLGLSYLVTTGNETATTAGDYVAALARDDQVDIIGVFLEGLRDPDRFAAAVVDARGRGKPVVALTVGRSELGRRAAMAHTGAIAGGAAAMRGFLRRVGVVQTADIDEFRECLLLFSAGNPPRAGGVALATISGGGAGLLGDLAEREHLDVAALHADTVRTIGALLPEFATVNNPLDVTGAAAERPELLTDTLRALRSDPGVGAVVMALNTACGADGQRELYQTHADALARAAATNGPPAIAMSLATGPVDARLGEILHAAGIPLLLGAGPGLAAITRWLTWHHGPVPSPLLRHAATRELAAEADGVLTGHRALDLIADAGIPVPPSYLAHDAATIGQAWHRLEPPVAVKVESPGLAHKTDAGGVELDITSVHELEVAAARIARRVAQHDPGIQVDGFLVQSQIVGPIVECLVGVVRDPQVGLVLSVAPGGVLAELNAAAQTTPLPASADDIEFLLHASPMDSLLSGYRGAPRADRGALVRLITRFSDLVCEFGPGLQAAELNPVLVLPDGQGAVAVDALVIGTVGSRAGSAEVHDPGVSPQEVSP